MADLVLLTIPFSHYCEKAKWALEHKRLAYREEPHVQFVSRLAGLRRGVWSSVPVLFTPGGPIPDSTAILEWADRQTTGNTEKLFPDDSNLGAKVREWEDLFDRTVGPHARRLVFGFLLPDTRLSVSFIESQNIPALEKLGTRTLFPLFREVIKRGLNITPDGMERSRQRMDEVFGKVSQELADGRKWLVGDRFTAADLTLAALSGPLVMPREYGSPLPPTSEMSAEARRLIEGYRSSPAGRHVLSVYERIRRTTSS